ncbi:MAG: hypothetical protein E6J27_05605 [Chloroflexi bacterium]|nr:MAG: hypothetical protein E6J27_05605 [Chloroflexota bacterium]
MTRLVVPFLVGALAGALAAVQPINDTDVWWHLATGRETLAQGIVRSDLFSWTVRGAPVSTDQWLGQVVLYLSYAVAGWWGVALLRVVLVGTLIAIVALDASGRVQRPLAVVLATMPALLLTRAVAVDRPELAGFVLFAALLYLLRRGRAGSWRALVACTALVGVWANVHGSFALGAVLTGFVCIEGALRDVARRREYIAVALATLAVTLATPAGIATWTAPGSHFLSPPRDIQEWNVVDVRTPLGVAYAATLALLIASVLAGPRIDPREAVIVIPVAFLSLTAARQAPLLAIAVAPLFAERVAWALAFATRGATAQISRPASTFLAAAAVAIAAMAVAIAPRAPDERAYPRAALDSIPHGDGLFARYEWGGWLIWNAPATPVFVDGRLFQYRGAVLDDYQRIVTAKQGWRDAVTRRGVRALLVVPSDPVAVRARELGWRVIASSESFVLIAAP